MNKSITESNKIYESNLTLNSVYICLVDNRLPAIMRYVFVMIWNNEKCYDINSKSHWSKFNNSRPSPKYLAELRGLKAQVHNQKTPMASLSTSDYSRPRVDQRHFYLCNISAVNIHCLTWPVNLDWMTLQISEMTSSTVIVHGTLSFFIVYLKCKEWPLKNHDVI